MENDWALEQDKSRSEMENDWAREQTKSYDPNNDQDTGQESRSVDQEQLKEPEKVEGATHGCSSKGLWPDSVSFREDDPKPGMAYIIPRIDALLTNVPLRGKPTALNGEVLEETFEPKLVCYRIKITSGESAGKVYEFKKSLPKEIVPALSMAKFGKNGQVKLRLKKAKSELSWATYRAYLTLPDEK